jgi:hypothetical protein
MIGTWPFKKKRTPRRFPPTAKMGSPQVPELSTSQKSPMNPNLKIVLISICIILGGASVGAVLSWSLGIFDDNELIATGELSELKKIKFSDYTEDQLTLLLSTPDDQIKSKSLKKNKKLAQEYKFAIQLKDSHDPSAQECERLGTIMKSTIRLKFTGDQQNVLNRLIEKCATKGFLKSEYDEIFKFLSQVNPTLETLILKPNALKQFKLLEAESDVNRASILGQSRNEAFDKIFKTRFDAIKGRDVNTPIIGNDKSFLENARDNLILTPQIKNEINDILARKAPTPPKEFQLMIDFLSKPDHSFEKLFKDGEDQLLTQFFKLAAEKPVETMVLPILLGDKNATAFYNLVIDFDKKIDTGIPDNQVATLELISQKLGEKNILLNIKKKVDKVLAEKKIATTNFDAIKSYLGGTPNFDDLCDGSNKSALQQFFLLLSIPTSQCKMVLVDGSKIYNAFKTLNSKQISVYLNAAQLFMNKNETVNKSIIDYFSKLNENPELDADVKQKIKTVLNYSHSLANSKIAQFSALSSLKKLKERSAGQSLIDYVVTLGREAIIEFISHISITDVPIGESDFLFLYDAQAKLEFNETLKLNNVELASVSARIATELDSSHLIVKTLLTNATDASHYQQLFKSYDNHPNPDLKRFLKMQVLNIIGLKAIADQAAFKIFDKNSLQSLFLMLCLQDSLSHLEEIKENDPVSSITKKITSESGLVWDFKFEDMLKAIEEHAVNKVANGFITCKGSFVDDYLNKHLGYIERLFPFYRILDCLYTAVKDNDRFEKMREIRDKTERWKKSCMAKRNFLMTITDEIVKKHMPLISNIFKEDFLEIVKLINNAGDKVTDYAKILKEAENSETFFFTITKFKIAAMVYYSKYHCIPKNTEKNIFFITPEPDSSFLTSNKNCFEDFLTILKNSKIEAVLNAVSGIITSLDKVFRDEALSEKKQLMEVVAFIKQNEFLFIGEIDEKQERDLANEIYTDIVSKFDQQHDKDFLRRIFQVDSNEKCDISKIERENLLMLLSPLTDSVIEDTIKEKIAQMYFLLNLFDYFYQNSDLEIRYYSRHVSKSALAKFKDSCKSYASKLFAIQFIESSKENGKYRVVRYLSSATWKIGPMNFTPFSSVMEEVTEKMNIFAKKRYYYWGDEMSETNHKDFPLKEYLKSAQEEKAALKTDLNNFMNWVARKVFKTALVPVSENGKQSDNVDSSRNYKGMIKYLDDAGHSFDKLFEKGNAELLAQFIKLAEKTPDERATLLEGKNIAFNNLFNDVYTRVTNHHNIAQISNDMITKLENISRNFCNKNILPAMNKEIDRIIAENKIRNNDFGDFKAFLDKFNLPILNFPHTVDKFNSVILRKFLYLISKPAKKCQEILGHDSEIYKKFEDLKNRYIEWYLNSYNDKKIHNFRLDSSAIELLEYAIQNPELEDNVKSSIIDALNYNSNL